MSHYDYLYENLPNFLDKYARGGFQCYTGIISAHGDKGYSYSNTWEQYGIPFEHGMMLYILSYCFPFSQEVRETKKGWVSPEQWVIDNYNKFKSDLK